MMIQRIPSMKKHDADRSVVSMNSSSEQSSAAPRKSKMPKLWFQRFQNSKKNFSIQKRRIPFGELVKIEDLGNSGLEETNSFEDVEKGAINPTIRLETRALTLWMTKMRRTRTRLNLIPWTRMALSNLEIRKQVLVPQNQRTREHRKMR